MTGPPFCKQCRSRARSLTPLPPLLLSAPCRAQLKVWSDSLRTDLSNTKTMVQRGGCQKTAVTVFHTLSHIHTPPPHTGFPMSAHLSRLRLFQRHLRSLVWVWVWVWDWIHSHTPRTRSPSSRHPPFTHWPFPPRSLVCGGQPSPHKPRLVVSHSTCRALQLGRSQCLQWQQAAAGATRVVLQRQHDEHHAGDPDGTVHGEQQPPDRVDELQP
jgi:hypothetical protein